MSIIQQMMVQQQQQQQHMSSQMTAAITALAKANTTQPTVAPPALPKYDGNKNNLPHYLDRMKDFMSSQFFSGVDWNTAQGASPSQEEYVRLQLKSEGSLPSHILSTFYNKPQYVNNGILMLKDLLASLNPSSPVNRLLSIKDLIKLEQNINEPPSDYMLRARILQQSLQGVVVSDLIHSSLLPTWTLTSMGGC